MFGAPVLKTQPRVAAYEVGKARRSVPRKLTHPPVFYGHRRDPGPPFLSCISSLPPPDARDTPSTHGPCPVNSAGHGWTGRKEGPKSPFHTPPLPLVSTHLRSSCLRGS